MSAYPPEKPPLVGVALIQANLAERGATVRPEVVSNEPDSGINKFHLNPLGLRATDPRPSEI